MGFPIRFIPLALALLAVPAQAEPPELPRGRGDACVEPTDIMRRQHMDFLLHQRDRTVHEGIRTPQHSLVECVDCHVQRNSDGGYIPVNAPEQFCQACHDYASVKLDCFECHATTPDSEDAPAPANTATGADGMHQADRLSVMSFGASQVIQ